MKLIFCFLIFFFIELHNAKGSSTKPNVIRIPLKTTRMKTERYRSGLARSRIILDDGTTTVGTISIGTPKQDFLVKFDTGSGDLWAYSSNYDTCEPSSQIVIDQHNTYSREDSKSHQQVITYHRNPIGQLVIYTLQWVFGFKIIDVVAIGNSQITTEFIEVTKTTEKRAQQKMDGIVGLRYNPTGSDIVSMFCNQTKAEPKFSYYLPKEKSAGVGGELLFCGEDSDKYISSTMKYYNDTSEGRWFVPLDSVTAEDPTKGSITLSSQSKAVLDTGSNRIAGPESNLTQFLNAVSSYIIGNSKQQEVDCQQTNLLPNVVFSIAGTKYTFTSDDYIVKLGRRTQRCFIGILGVQVGQWILGEPFFRKYYTVFDIKNRRIGIAQSKG